jgi:hypothetical protein
MRKSFLKLPMILGILVLFGAIALAQAETIQRGGIRVALDGDIAPNRLPRSGSAPVTVQVKTKISSTSKAHVPQLTKISIAINRYGRLDATGLPVCRISDIQPSTNEKALEVCGDSRIGDGQFSATVALSKQVAFPSAGKMIAFNGTYHGKPAILAHVYGTDPIPTSFTLPFVIGKSHGTFGTTLTATLPASEGNFVTGLDLALGRSFTYRGQKRSYASASCPAPKGFPGAPFAFAKATYSFAGGPRLSTTLTRNCRVKG